MAKLVREEGDHTYWSDGAVRWAYGNSMGKQPGSLAKRHPKAAAPIATAAQGRALGRKGNEIKAETWRSAAQDGMVKALEETGKIPQGSGPAEAFGAIVSSQTGMATDPELGRAATGAARFVAESVGAMSRGGDQVQALVVNVQIGEGVQAKYLEDEGDVVDGTFTEPAESEKERETYPHVGAEPDWGVFGFPCDRVSARSEPQEFTVDAEGVHE